MDTVRPEDPELWRDSSERRACRHQRSFLQRSNVPVNLEAAASSTEDLRLRDLNMDRVKRILMPGYVRGRLYGDLALESWSVMGRGGTKKFAMERVWDEDRT